MRGKDGCSVHLSDYVEQAMAQAGYDKLEDGTFAGRISSCPGVIAFGATLRECEDELHSTLEDWILVGIKLGRPLPIIGGIDLNAEYSIPQQKMLLKEVESILGRTITQEDWNAMN